MANLGLSKLGAVNRIIYSANERPVAALDTDGASIQSDAERFLDDFNVVVQSYGWPENTHFFEEFTPSGGTITVPSDTLALWSSGKNEYRTLVLNGDRVYDADTFSFNVGTAALTFDRVRLLSFTEESIDRFETLRSQKLGVRANDLRIAAIALTNGATVVTRNVSDFGRVPGLLVENWAD